MEWPLWLTYICYSLQYWKENLNEYCLLDILLPYPPPPMLSAKKWARTPNKYPIRSTFTWNGHSGWLVCFSLQYWKWMMTKFYAFYYEEELVWLIAFGHQIGSEVDEFLSKLILVNHCTIEARYNHNNPHYLVRKTPLSYESPLRNFGKGKFE